jgi:CHAT domain-containing protein
MPHISVRVLLALFLTTPVWSVPHVLAQQDPSAQESMAAEFARVWQRLLDVQNAEEQIALADKALKLEPELQQWPLSVGREEGRARLWRWQGLGHEKATSGDRAENLDRAIAAYTQALQILTPERSAQDWATLQNDLGIAYQDRIRGERADNLEKAITAFESALTIRTRDAFPREWADTQSNLAGAYQVRIRDERVDNLEKAIGYLEAALTVFTHEALPLEWAETQNDLAAVFLARIRGERADNLEKAIAHLEAALTVLTRGTQPLEWAQTQNSLGIAYQTRIRGEPADNLEKAIAAFEAALTIRTREALPLEWADTQNNLANGYWNRIRGQRADNLETAIAAFEAALTIRTREALPREWAQTKNNLGIAYQTRIRGERVDNLEMAVAAFEAALTVFTRETMAFAWAQAQNNLAAAYWNRISGERADNLEKAIAAFEAALTVFTRETVPFEWAQAQNNLANVYQNRGIGERDDNLEKAIAAFEAALTVFTRDALPRQWAEARNNLAATYLTRIRGERADNLENAITLFESALTVLTREALPLEWAQAQSNLAAAYRDRIRGEGTDNREKRIAHLEAALTVFTRGALPREHLRVGRLLGGALLEAREWHKAGSVFASAREAFLLLFGQGLNDAEARDLIATAGPLFAEAAFAAIQRKENATALTLASEGRARHMAVALKLLTLDLSTGKRQQLDEMRAAIRAELRAVEAAQGTERAAAMEKLINLRQEVLRLVQSSTTAESEPESALVQARSIAVGGAVIVPIITRLGAKILIVTGADRGLTVVDVPELTTEKLDVLVRGGEKTGGWLAAYNINYLQGAEQDQRWPEWTAAIKGLGPQLWSLFGARLNAALKKRGIKRGARLVWLPSGALGILPLGLAQNPANKRYFADDYEIVYAPSLGAMTGAQAHIRKVVPAKLTAVINPTGDLAGTEKEGVAVASHFARNARTVLERDKATVENVLAALKGKTHWHFASHGTFSWDDARKSALLMHGDTLLSVGRLLETDGLGRPRLVVLSACETGLYDIGRNPDEFIGLPGAFTALGAAGVLGTLWPVDDHATWLLVTKFYELHMGVARLPPPAALRQAQAWLRDATEADLLVYAKEAAKQGRLEARHLHEIEKALSEEGLNRSHNRSLVEWIVPDARPAAPQTRPARAKGAARTAKPVARPYAHPYFWAGFIHTGL